MPYCSKCGKPVRDDDSFCQSCGNQIQPPLTAGSTPGHTTGQVNSQSPASASGFSGDEAVVAIIPDLNKSKALGMKDCYYLIATSNRSIFIKLTAPIMQKAAQYNMAKNPNQNRSMWSRWKAQVAGPNIYLQYLSSLPPEQALLESNENFALDNSQISKVKCTLRLNDEDPAEWHLEFQSGAGTHKFVTGSNPETLLKAVFAGKLTK